MCLWGSDSSSDDNDNDDCNDNANDDNVQNIVLSIFAID